MKPWARSGPGLVPSQSLCYSRGMTQGEAVIRINYTLTCYRASERKTVTTDKHEDFTDIGEAKGFREALDVMALYTFVSMELV